MDLLPLSDLTPVTRLPAWARLLELWSTGALLFAVPNTTGCLIGGLENSTGAQQRVQGPEDGCSIVITVINRRKVAANNVRRENRTAHSDMETHSTRNDMETNTAYNMGTHTTHRGGNRSGSDINKCTGQLFCISVLSHNKAERLVEDNQVE